MNVGKENLQKGRSLIPFILLGLIVLFVLSYGATFIFQKPEMKTSQVAGVSTFVAHKEIQPEGPVYGIPVRLMIPKINLDANIFTVGLTADGDMEVPKKIMDLGWYKYGPHPGELGSAVIAGHLGVGEAGIFINLDKLEIGDTFSIIDDKGQSVSFVVRETKTYNPTDRPAEVFFSDSGAHVNLITCAGDWDKAKQGMSKRLVVFSDKI